MSMCFSFDHLVYVSVGNIGGTPTVNNKMMNQIDNMPPPVRCAHAAIVELYRPLHSFKCIVCVHSPTGVLINIGYCES